MLGATAEIDVLRRYDRVAIALHWLIAVGVIGQIALGWWMIDIPKQPAGVRAWWFNVHKSVGMTLAALIVLRILWRVLHRPPPLPAQVPSWQAGAARASHFLLYACMVVMPLAGYLGSTFSGYPIKLYGLTLPAWGWRDDAAKDFFSALHLTTACIFMGLIALHVAAALKHGLLDRDGVFTRMWPGVRTVRAPTEYAQRRHGA